MFKISPSDISNFASSEKDERAQVATRRETQHKPNMDKQPCGPYLWRRVDDASRSSRSLSPSEQRTPSSIGMGMEEGPTKGKATAE